MSTTSVLYHGFGVRGYKYLKTEYQKGNIIFHIERDPHKRCCAECGSKRVKKKGHFSRELRAVPIGKKKVFLCLHLHRLQCKVCRSLKLEPLILSFPKKHWTKSLGRYVVELLKERDCRRCGSAFGDELGYGKGDTPLGIKEEV
ncbi:MAG: hypothetical protein AMS17_15700 [Spirochaetes bacterium DG_61]|jgi:transposase|nr:MAG: hypothetical protein AMS17_15700 [Spirochaetes bacterium DG_61]